MKRNLLVMQSGGVTAVINQSLAGVVQEAVRQGAFGRIYGAIHGRKDCWERHYSTWDGSAEAPGRQ